MIQVHQCLLGQLVKVRGSAGEEYEAVVVGVDANNGIWFLVLRSDNHRFTTVHPASCEALN